ncbi:MAG: ABC transporter permease subunit [Candidatus Rokuibacteriota bacterium]
MRPPTLGVLLGIAASRRFNSWGDYLISAVSMVGYSTPPFWLGIIFIVIFASGLRWLPTQGDVHARRGVAGHHSPG